MPMSYAPFLHAPLDIHPLNGLFCRTTWVSWRQKC